MKVMTREALPGVAHELAVFGHYSRYSYYYTDMFVVASRGWSHDLEGRNVLKGNCHGSGSRQVGVNSPPPHESKTRLLVLVLAMLVALRASSSNNRECEHENEYDYVYYHCYCSCYCDYYYDYDYDCDLAQGFGSSRHAP